MSDGSAWGRGPTPRDEMTLSTPARLVILAPNWLGDIVMALPAMAGVRQAFPEAHLAVAARRGLAGLFDAVPSVDEVIPLEGRRRDDAARLRAGRFDVALLLPNSFAAAWLAWRAGVAGRWGYRTDGRRLLLTRAIGRPSRQGHQAEYYQELVRRLGLAAGPPAPPLQVDESMRRRARALLERHGWTAGRPLVGVAPGAAYGHAKRWPPERFAAVIRALAADGVQAVVVGTAQDADAALDIERALGDPGGDGPVNLVGRTDLAALIGVLSQCRSVVTNDSGAMHLAAALGVPVTAMFGPTDERVTAPLPLTDPGAAGRAHVVLTHAVRCRPCLLRECPIDHRCMTGIRPEDVLAAVRRQLG